MLTMLSTMAPMFMILALGYLLGFSKIFRNFQAGLNHFVFYLSLPAFVYISIVTAPVPDEVPLGVFVIAGGLTAAVSVMTYYIVKLNGRTYSEYAAPTSLGSTFGNVGYFGIPITIAALGTDASVPAAIVHLIHNIMFLVGYPLIRSLSLNHKNANGQKTALKDTFKKLWPIIQRSVLLNPVALAMVVALLLVQFEIPSPTSVTESIGMLGATAVPLALITVGLAMHPAIEGIRQGGIPIRFVFLGAGMKVLGLPLITLAAVALFTIHLGPIWGATLILMAAMPSSTTVFILSAQYDRNGYLAAAITASSTVLSLGTIPLFASFIL